MPPSTSDRDQRISWANALRTNLESIDGVEEAVINDATPKTWQSVELFVCLPGEPGWIDATTRGVRLDETVNLRSVAQRLHHTVNTDDRVSAFEIRSRPKKQSNACHDTGCYILDVRYP